MSRWDNAKIGRFTALNFLARPFVSGFNLRHMKKQKAYAAAGVDIDLGNKVKATLPQLLAATHRRLL